LLGYVGDDRIETSNLPVKAIAVQSVLAAEDDEQRLAAGPRSFAAFFPIAQPMRLGWGRRGNLRGTNETEQKKNQKNEGIWGTHKR
jgi:hypothetical protein